MSSSPKFYDLVMETSTTTGTGTLTLAGAVSGFQTFAVVGDGNSCYYCIQAVDANGNPTGAYEVGLGTYTVSGTTLSRDTVLASSNSNSAVNFLSGTKRVFVVAPATLFTSLIAVTETAITGTVTLTASAYGKQHIVSGTSADYTVGLPTAVGHAGEIITFRFSAALTKLVTLDGSGSETIAGELTQVYWANETVVIQSDGTNFARIGGTRILMSCYMELVSAQTLPNAVMTDVLLDNAINDPTSAMADTTNHRINIKRTGTYLITARVVMSASDSSNGFGADAARCLGQISGSVNGAGQAQITAGEMFGKTGGYPSPTCTVIIKLFAGDWIKIAGYQTSGAGQGFFGTTAGSPCVAVAEY